MNAIARLALALAAGLALAWPSAAQQMPITAPLPEEETKAESPAAQKFRELTGADDAKKEKEKTKPPFEFYKSQIAPFDILPFVKAGHWNTLSLELRANYVDYAGWLQSSPVRLKDMPHQVLYRREARLQKEQDARLSMQVMLPQPAREMLLELTRPEAIRADGSWQASLLRLEPHQMLIVILATDPSAYNPWAKYNATVPSSGEKEGTGLERHRYYKLVLPMKPEKPPLSPHPLTWTTISHVVWDGLAPESLNLGQQSALVDWLHWGGQLIVNASGPAVAPLQDSFLGPHLPATLSGQNASLTGDDLAPMAEAYLPPLWPGVWQEQNDFDTQSLRMPRYMVSEPIVPGPLRPVLFAGLTPKAGATPLYLNGKGGRLLGVEWRIGRGRVLMLAFNPVDPAFLSWNGMDSFVRRVVLRRQEETPSGQGDDRYYQFLNGAQVSWVRYLGRDLGTSAPSPPVGPPGQQTEIPLPVHPVAAWSDTESELPRTAREALVKASGISIPPSSFVLKVVVAYGIVLVPVNWLLCRFLLRRREWAWAMVPMLALGAAVLIERLAAYDLGYDSACDEIDLLEIQGGHPNAHLNRFAALYSTGRDAYSIAYPDDPTALALPLNMERSLRGEDIAQSVWQSSPEPALIDFQVQPRSLAMFRAEAMVNLGGRIVLHEADDKGPRRIVNATGLELRDAVLMEMDHGGEIVLGTIPAGATVEVREREVSQTTDKTQLDWIDPKPFLARLRDFRYNRPEDAGELRLVAWAPKPHPGQSIEPEVDRHRGFRLVVAHLRYGPPPDPGASPYFSYQPGHPVYRPRRHRSLNEIETEGEVESRATPPPLPLRNRPPRPPGVRRVLPPPTKPAMPR